MTRLRAETDTKKIANREYRDCLGAAVNIVTTDGSAGRAGFTASAVCSVTDDPPTLLVCINRSSSAYASVRANGVVCVNVLSPRHQQLSQLFGGKLPAEERFAATAWSTLETGAPVLADGAVAFDCQIVDVANIGTHDVLFCRVVALRHTDYTDSLIYLAATITWCAPAVEPGEYASAGRHPAHGSSCAPRIRNRDFRFQSSHI